MKILVNCLIMMVCLLALSPSVGYSGEISAATASEVATTAVSLNSATAKQLQILPGIGAVTADRIVAYRKAHGPFANVEDLLHVKGIGTQTLSKIRDRIVLN